MNTSLNTLSDELYQVNTHVGHIARWQVRLDGFVESPSPPPPPPPPEASEDGSDDDDDDEDGDASSSSTDKMST